MRLFCSIAVVLMVTGSAIADPLPSWNDNAAKAQIIDFIGSVTDPASPEYVTPSQRVAVFDNDGTLWAEKPVYFQLLYALDKLKQKAAANPEILTSATLEAAAAGDMDAVAKSGEEGLLEIVMASHAGLSVDAFTQDVANWIKSAKHPTRNVPYTDMTYQPMLELLRFLRDEGFDTYIVSGGGIHFMRAFVEEAYGIPPEKVIGSAGVTRYAVVEGVPTILKDPGIAFIDDKAGKPVGIDNKIGKNRFSWAATRTVILRCWNGRRQETVPGSGSSFITRMRNANGLMTGTVMLASLSGDWMKDPIAVGC